MVRVRLGFSFRGELSGSEASTTGAAAAAILAGSATSTGLASGADLFSLWTGPGTGIARIGGAGTGAAAGVDSLGSGELTVGAVTSGLGAGLGLSAGCNSAGSIWSGGKPNVACDATGNSQNRANASGVGRK